MQQTLVIHQGDYVEHCAAGSNISDMKKNNLLIDIFN